MKSPKKILISVLIFIFLVILSACFGTKPPASAVIYSMTPPAIGVNITRTNCPSVEVQKGTQVAWVNMDDREHIVHITGPQGTVESNVIDSGELQPGDVFTATLPDLGTYSHECSKDGMLTGTITVMQ